MAILILKPVWVAFAEDILEINLWIWLLLSERHRRDTWQDRCTCGRVQCLNIKRKKQEWKLLKRNAAKIWFILSSYLVIVKVNACFLSQCLLLILCLLRMAAAPFSWPKELTLFSCMLAIYILIAVSSKSADDWEDPGPRTSQFKWTKQFFLFFQSRDILFPKHAKTQKTLSAVATVHTMKILTFQK